MHSRGILAIFLSSLVISSILFSMLPIEVLSHQVVRDSDFVLEQIQVIDPMPFDQNATIKAYRTVKVSPYGFATYNDTIIISNNEEREFNSILIFYNKSTFNLIKDITILGYYKGKTLKLDWVKYTQKGPFIGMALLLKMYVEKDTTYKIFILGRISSVPEFEAKGEEILYRLFIPQKILLPYNVTHFKATFESLDPTSRIDINYVYPTNGSVQGDRILFYTIRNKYLFNFTKPGEEIIVKFAWFSKTPIVLVTTFEREMKIEITEKIYIRDFFEIKVIAPKSDKTPKETPWKLTTFIIGLPSDVKSLKARDDIGKIRITESASELIPENYTAYSVSLRIPLVSSSSYSFILDYYIKSGTQWFEVEDQKWRINIPLTPIVNTTILNLKYKIFIPEGYNLNSTALQEFNSTKYVDWGVLGILSYNILTGSFSQITPQENKELDIVVEPTPLPLVNAFIKIFFLALFVLSLFNITYVYYQRLREKALVLLPEVIVELRDDMGKFLRYYEEFVAIEKKLDDFIRSKLTQRKSPKTIRDQLQKLLETNKKYRDRVIAFYERVSKDPDVAKIIRELRDIENRISTTRREAISDWSQFLRGTLSKKEILTRADELFSNLRTLKTNRSRLINRIRNIYIARYVRKA